MNGLSEEQQQQFYEQGYLMVPDVIDAKTIDAVRSEIDREFDREAQAMVAEGHLAGAFSDAGFDYQLAKIAQQDLGLARELVARVQGTKGSGGLMGPGVFGLLTHSGLLSAIESLVGPEIIGSSVYRIRPKAPGLPQGAVPWHQDSGYLMGHCDKELIVTCWVPLVDANIENGCLYVIPGAHRSGILKHHSNGPANFLIIQDEDLPAGLEPVAVPVPRGGVLLLTNMTPHASFLNTSDHVRWSLDLRYQSAGVPHNVGKMPGDIDPDAPEVEIACYPPEADFVLRSPSAPGAEIKNWEQLRDLRNDYFEGRKALRVHPDRWEPVPAE